MKFYSSQNFVMGKNCLMGGVGAILADWDIFYFHRRMQCFSNSCRDIMRLVTVQYLIDSPQNDSKFFVVFRWPYPYLFLLSRGIQAMSRYVALTPTGSLQAGLASRQRINIFLIKKKLYEENDDENNKKVLPGPFATISASCPLFRSVRLVVVKLQRQDKTQVSKGEGGGCSVHTRSVPGKHCHSVTSTSPELVIQNFPCGNYPRVILSLSL